MALDHTILGLVGLWSLVAALAFSGTVLTWLVFADAIALGDLLAIWPPDERCGICGVVMVRAKARADCPSIDRIDNTSGYSPGNIHVVCVGCNGRKSNHTMAGLACRDDVMGHWARARMETVPAIPCGSTGSWAVSPPGKVGPPASGPYRDDVPRPPSPVADDDCYPADPQDA